MAALNFPDPTQQQEYKTWQWNGTSWVSVISGTAFWDSTYTTVNAESANWDNTYTTVDTKSANWQSTYTTVDAESANWDSTYTTVDAESANWDSTYTTTLANSANWQSTYTTVDAKSANWDSTYTTVESSSGIWDNSAALAYNDGASNSIEIGVLDGTTQTGNYAVTIQGRRSTPDQVAIGGDSIAIGSNSKAGTATKGNSVAIGTSCTATGASSIAIGHNSSGGAEATSDQAVAIGPGCKANNSIGAIAIGNVSNASGEYGAAIGVGCDVGSNTSRSTAFGYNVNVKATGVSEFGRWRASTERRGAVRCSGQSGDESNIDAMVCITTLSSPTAKLDGGSIVGSEPANTIPRGMHTIRQWDDTFYLDGNDGAGNITTVPLGGGGTVINSVLTVTSNTYTQAAGNTHTIYNDDDAGVTSDITATLMPAADHTGTSVHKKIGNSHNVVITPPVGATIDGQSSFTLQFENESISIFSDGTNFYIT